MLILKVGSLLYSVSYQNGQTSVVCRVRDVVERSALFSSRNISSLGLVPQRMSGLVRKGYHNLLSIIDLLSLPMSYRHLEARLGFFPPASQSENENQQYHKKNNQHKCTQSLSYTSSSRMKLYTRVPLKRPSEAEVPKSKKNETTSREVALNTSIEGT